MAKLVTSHRKGDNPLQVKFTWKRSLEPEERVTLTSHVGTMQGILRCNVKSTSATVMRKPGASWSNANNILEQLVVRNIERIVKNS